MPDAVLAIDQGTTGSTALVFSRDGRVLSRAYSEFTQHYPEPGAVEHDPEEIWRVSLRVMGEAVAAAGLAAGELRAIGITNQRETTIVWDRRTGAPIHRAVVWQSRQSAPICDALRRAGHEALFRERTGLVTDAYFSGTKVRFLLDRVPDAQRRAEAGELAFGTVDTWLLHRLSGGRVHATEPTNASRTLLFDIHRRAWDADLLSLLGVPAAMLPELRPSAGVFGETVAQDGLPAGIPIAGVAGDQQAALYGQACWEPGMAKNTYGTGAFLLMHTGQEHRISPGGLLTTLAADARGRPAYALEGSIFVAGAAVQWLRDELGLVARASETEQIARSVPDSAGVYVVPAFAGLGAPYWDMEARGAIVGLTRGANRRHLVRATLESLAYQTRDVIDVMNRDSGTHIRELRVDGGAASNDFLMQFQADVLGVPVERPALVETTAAGAAYLAGVGVGLFRDPAELDAARRVERRFEPRLSDAERDRLYAGWTRAVARVRS
jgi:glycerol kinase